GAEVAASGNEVVVVEMPDKGRPGIVEHPLNDPCGDVLIAGVGFEHGAFVVVSHGLGFALVIVEGRGGAVALGEGVSEDIDSGEALAASMKIPVVINGPEMFLGNEFGEALLGVDRGAGTRFGFSTLGAPSLRFAEPIHGWNIFVRAGHLDAG